MIINQKLEDEFDGANRKNLLHFIQEQNGTNSRTSQSTFEGRAVEPLRGLTYVSRVLERSPSAESTDVYGKEHMIEKRELMRISTCAIFHKYTRGPGVPHTFVGFIRQWPALPQVVVCNYCFACYSLLIDYNRSSCQFVFCLSRTYLWKNVTLSGKSERLEVRVLLSFHRCYKTIGLGIYGVTYYLGFRDEFNVEVNLRTLLDYEDAYSYLA